MTIWKNEWPSWLPRLDPDWPMMLGGAVFLASPWVAAALLACALMGWI